MTSWTPEYDCIVMRGGPSGSRVAAMASQTDCFSIVL